jgi:hypothetical protein
MINRQAELDSCRDHDLGTLKKMKWDLSERCDRLRTKYGDADERQADPSERFVLIGEVIFENFRTSS